MKDTCINKRQITLDYYTGYSPRAFNCFPRELIIAKVNSYSVHFISIEVNTQLTVVQKEANKNKYTSFISWKEILFSVPQGSIIDPLFLKAFACDLFSMLSNIDFESYAVMLLRMM